LEWGLKGRWLKWGLKRWLKWGTYCPSQKMEMMPQLTAQITTALLLPVSSCAAAR
jgi:hypothetical protein